MLVLVGNESGRMISRAIGGGTYSLSLNGKARCTLLLTGLFGVICSNQAGALPSFGIQSNQPCSACHVGGFGPRLKQAGRDFKLYGYTANDTHEHFPPLSVLGEASFTHTNTDQPNAAGKP